MRVQKEEPENCPTLAAWPASHAIWSFIWFFCSEAFNFQVQLSHQITPRWKVFVVQQLPPIFQFYILDWETPLQNEKEPRPTPFFSVQDIAIYSYNSIFHCKLRLEQKEN
jgi:hypothetical protein